MTAQCLNVQLALLQELSINESVQLHSDAEQPFCCIDQSYDSQRSTCNPRKSISSTVINGTDSKANGQLSNRAVSCSGDQQPDEPNDLLLMQLLRTIIEQLTLFGIRRKRVKPFDQAMLVQLLLAHLFRFLRLTVFCFDGCIMTVNWLCGNCVLTA